MTGIKLGPGGLLSNPEQEVAAARRLFWAAVRRLAPEVIESLRTDVLPVFMALTQEARQTGGELCVAWLHFVYTSPMGVRITDESNMPQLPAERLKLFETSLRTWAGRWNICVEWVLNRAKEALAYWAMSPPEDRAAVEGQCPQGWERHPLAGWPEKDFFNIVKPRPKPPLWNPSAESWDEYIASLEDYRREVLAAWKEHGWTKARVKRSRSGPADIHYEWLVRYQLLKESHKEIAEISDAADPIGKSFIDVSTVRRGIAGAAKLIGLPLRRGHVRSSGV